MANGCRLVNASVTPHPKPLSKEGGLKTRWFYTSAAKVLSFAEDLGEAYRT